MPDSPAGGDELELDETGSSITTIADVRDMVGFTRQLWVRRLMRAAGVVALLLALVGMAGIPGSEARAAGRFMVWAVVLLTIGAYLVSRPLPIYPLRAAIGSLLLVAGAFWLEAATDHIPSTWLYLYAWFPEPVADFLEAIGLDQPGAGLLALLIGLSATFSGTWQRSERVGVVLYGAGDERTESPAPRHDGDGSDAGEHGWECAILRSRTRI